MKQTNAAITFLMAQYRAIYKHALSKSISAALILTSGLACASSNAANLDNNNWADAFENNAVVEVDGKTSPTAGKYQNVTITGSTNNGTNLSLDEGKKLVISDVTSAATENKFATTTQGEKLSITGAGTIDITAVDKDATKHGLTISAAAGGLTLVDVKNLYVQGNLDITTDANDSSSVVVGAENIVVGDNITTTSANTTYGIATITLGKANTSGDAVLGGANTTITINKDGKLVANGINTGNDEGAAVYANELKLNGGSIDISADTDHVLSYDVNKTNITDGFFNVKKGSKLQLELERTGQINLNGSSTLSVADTMNITEGYVSVSDASKVVATTEGAQITLGSDDSQNDTYLRVNSNTLKSFLSGKTVGADGEVTTTDLKYKTDAFSAEQTAASGAIAIQNRGVLEFTDPTDIADFTYAETVDGTAANNKGKIIFTKQDDAGIYGENLTVSEKLTGASNVRAFAKNLTIGSKTFDSSTGDLGVKLLEGDHITFVPKAGADTFTLKNLVIIDPLKTGSVTGAVDVNGGAIKVEFGNVTFNDDVTLTSGQGLPDQLSMSISDARTVVTFLGNFETTANGKIATEDSVIDLTKAKDFKLAANSVTIEDLGLIKLNGASFIDLSSADSVKLDNDKYAQNAVNATNAGIMSLAGMSTMNMAQYKDLVTKTGFNGFFEGFNVTGVSATDKMTFDANATLSGTPTSVYHGTQMTVDGEIKDKAYSFGGIALKDGQDKLTIKNTVTTGLSGVTVKLTNSAVNSNGNLIQKADGSTADVHFTGQKASLHVMGSGKVGSLTADQPTAQQDNIGHVVIGDVHGHSNYKLEVEGNIGSNLAPLNGLMVSPSNSLEVKGDEVHLKELYVTNDATMTAKDADIIIKHTTKRNDDDYSNIEVYGDLTAKSLIIATASDEDYHMIAGGATVTLDDLSVAKVTDPQGTKNGLFIAGGATVNVKNLNGDEKVEFLIGEDSKEGLGATVIVDTLNLNGASVYVDPEYGKEASYLIVNNLKDAQIDGKVTVGKNAVTAIGFDNKNDVEATISDYLDEDRSFRPGSAVRNALILNKGITLSGTDSISIDPSATGVSGNNGNVTFGQGGALIVTDAALTDTQGKKTKPAITLNNTTKTDIDAAAGGVVLLSGKFSSADKNIQLFAGSNVKVKGGSLSVRSVNGLLSSEIKEGSDGTITELKLDPEKLNSQMAVVSAPVRDLVGKILGDESDKYVTDGLGADYLYEIATNSITGAEIDAVAHAATYAGAQQAAIAATFSLVDAIAGRAGTTGIETTALAATGSQAQGGVWLTPMYKSVKSDGFDAQGASYGADVDLAGVTFGADTVRGNLRFGAAFNIGSGDADGKGNGNGLKDEFDYYGFGMYAGMDFNSFSLVADASYNVISHDVEGFSGLKDYGNVTASADTTALSLGLTGQHTIVTEYADVTPHVGLRFTRLDTDSYEMKTNKGSIGTTDFDVQNVFSLPVGVTLAKAFENHGWVFAPQADITLTFNAGDTESKSTVRFDGIKLHTALETELMDKVTYGLNLGFAAQSGNFGTSLSVGYTGSSNTDSVGINANARYMF